MFSDKIHVYFFPFFVVGSMSANPRAAVPTALRLPQPMAAGGAEGYGLHGVWSAAAGNATGRVPSAGGALPAFE